MFPSCIWSSCWIGRPVDRDRAGFLNNQILGLGVTKDWRFPANTLVWPNWEFRLGKEMAGVFKLLSVVALGLAAQYGAATAEDNALRKLLTADEARAWQAVGRLNIGTNSFCTGALVAPDLVLTAAHCLYDPDTGQPVNSSSIEFLAGWRNGRAVAYRKARRFVVHDDYDLDQHVVLKRVSSDVALIELDRPIRDSAVVPFKRFDRPDVGENVKVVSYAKERSEAPSIEEPCSVLDADRRTLVLSCTVDFGASGSPIFINDQGEAKIASVVSAMAKWRDRDVSLGVSLGRPLEELFDKLTQTSGVFRSHKPGTLSLGEQLGRKKAGTDFFE